MKMDDGDSMVDVTHSEAKPLQILIDSISELRVALQTYVSKNPATDNEVAAKDEAYLSLLSQIIRIKVSEDTILSMVEGRRRDNKQTGEKLMQLRVKLNNLQYERKQLHSEIGKCKGTQSSKLDEALGPLGLNPFSASGGSGSDAAVQAAHDALNKELEERQELQRKVEKLQGLIDGRKQEYKAEQEKPKNLPRQIQAIVDVIRPVQRALGGASALSGADAVPCGVGKDEELQGMSKLPQPLYVLARQAVAHREAFDKDLKVAVAVNKAAAGDMVTGSELYAEHESKVVVQVGRERKDSDKDIRAEEGEIDENGALGDETESERMRHAHGVQLRVTFRFVSVLGVVTVVGEAVDGDDLVSENYPLSELRGLFPDDDGARWPVGKAEALLERRMKENGVSRADEMARVRGRAFVWTNVAAGVECMPHPEAVRWTDEVRRLGEHVRFGEVVGALKRRLLSAVHLRRVVDFLAGSGRVNPVTPADIGLGGGGRAVAAKVSDFRRTDGRPEEWRMKVEGIAKKLTLHCTVWVNVDEYPHVAPTFEVREAVAKGVQVPERNNVELQRVANEARVSHAIAHVPELVLGTQVATLLHVVGSIDDGMARGAEVDAWHGRDLIMLARASNAS